MKTSVNSVDVPVQGVTMMGALVIDEIAPAYRLPLQHGQQADGSALYARALATKLRVLDMYFTANNMPPSGLLCDQSASWYVRAPCHHPPSAIPCSRFWVL